ncbi:MAG: HAD family hydrolase [Desulfobacterales bacterium]
MNLVMFDIDGTLTATTDIDEGCYVQAVEAVLNIDNIDTDLTHYTHVTDEGIAVEIIERHRGRKATEKELLDLRHYFVGLIEEHILDYPADLHPIEGAGEMMADLSRRTDCAVSLATGGWQESAILKIRAAGLDIEDSPMATSNDAISREDIMALSAERACDRYNVDCYDSVVYVGDGMWDLRAAHAMGYHFVGVAEGSRASQMRKEGANHIVPDFANREGFIGILETLWADQP